MLSDQKIKNVKAEAHIPKEDAFLLTRAALTTSRPKSLHVQDYGEVFWVQNGAAWHYDDQGRRLISEGDVVFVQPDMPHAFQAKTKDTYVTAVLVRSDILEEIYKAHFELNGSGFWTEDGRALISPRNLTQRSQLSGSLRTLEQGEATELRLKAFLLPLLASLPKPQNGNIPLWLVMALADAEAPDVFSQGAAGLVKSSGKTAAHVSRTCQKFLGRSPSQLMNARRMTYAAKLLAHTDESLSEIAAACGLGNLSHFHRLFQSHHQTSPAAWRRAHQKNVITP